MKDKIRYPLQSCIINFNPLEKMNFGQVISSKEDEKSKSQDQFICKTCLGYLKKNKLPPHSVMNHLELKETDAQIEDQGLTMTELENSLIASRIIFQKIFLLPSSRWSALKDKQVNIPITSSKINHNWLFFVFTSPISPSQYLTHFSFFKIGNLGRIT